ncbi:hypothetical protein CDAR_439301 [Caerostris darwini]|uniref:Uncharacterized protein n=1 Tax=Caerostris darwini TaxID=1538125 RepID=A0AAV4MHR9_9ARAC|nr:hypothetical protein CDAR_439301 [Caerostris darwini]
MGRHWHMRFRKNVESNTLPMPHTMICMFYLPRARIDVCPNPPTARFIDLNQILRGWPARTYDWDDPLGGGTNTPTEIRKSRLHRWSLLEPPSSTAHNSTLQHTTKYPQKSNTASFE